MTAAPNAAGQSARLRQAVRAATLADEAAAVANRVISTGLSPDDRSTIERSATELVRAIRQGAKPGIMETFLAEYGLSTNEGVALMCLAEALLRASMFSSAWRSSLSGSFARCMSRVKARSDT